MTPASAPQKPRVGITSLLWGNPAGDLFEPWLEEVKALGYEGVSGFSDWGWQLLIGNPGQFRSQLAKAGLRLASMIAPLDLNFDRYRRLFDLLNENDCENLIILGGFGREAREFEFVCDMMGYLSEAGAPRKIRVTYHNHTDNTGETYEQFCRIMDSVPLAWRNVMVDVGHATKDFIDLPPEQRARAVLDRYEAAISMIELKDFSPESGLNTALGEGQVNLGSVAEKVRSMNYSGWLVVEQNGDATMRSDGRSNACARRSRDVVRALFGV